MDKKSWIIIVVVSLVSLLIIISLFVKIMGNDDGKNEYGVNENDVVNNEDNEDKKQEENEQEDKYDKEKANENVKKLENLLSLEEGKLASKEELDDKINKWVDEGILETEDNTSYAIEQKITEEYSVELKDGYEEGKLVDESMDDFDVNQIAASYPTENIYSDVVYGNILPMEDITNNIGTEIKKEPTMIYGEEVEDEFSEGNPHYFRDVGEFKNFGEGLNLGYFHLEYRGSINSDAELDYWTDLGADQDEIEDLTGFNVVFGMKIDEQMETDDIKELISNIDVSGKTGERIFELESEESNHNFPKDTILEVSVPVDMEDILGKEETLKNVKKWTEGDLDNPEIEVNDTKIELKEMSKEDYEEGVFLEK